MKPGCWLPLSDAVVSFPGTSGSCSQRGTFQGDGGKNAEAVSGAVPLLALLWQPRPGSWESMLRALGLVRSTGSAAS
jgi:hypothetical protein